MAQSLSQVHIHIVFHTKTMTIRRTDLPRLWAYIAGVARGVGSMVTIVGGETDHVHMLCTLPRTITMSDFLEEIKRNSSHWIKSLSPQYNEFTWQRGYGVFSVSQSKLPIVENYIKNQEEHHRRVSFREEYEQWLQQYDIAYDDKYLWSD